MTQEQIEQTRVIAEKDGWAYVPHSKYLVKDNDRGIIGHPIDKVAKKLLTDLNTLHEVAMDVMGEIALMQFEVETVAYNCTLDDEMLIMKQELEIFKTPFNCIRAALTKRPINGQYIDLFNAVYDGVVFLNENKTE